MEIEDLTVAALILANIADISDELRNAHGNVCLWHFASFAAGQKFDRYWIHSGQARAAALIC